MVWARDLGGFAVEVGAGGGCGSGGVGHFAGRGRGDADLVDVDLEFFGYDLGDLDVEPLPISVPPWFRWTLPSV